MKVYILYIYSILRNSITKSSVHQQKFQGLTALRNTRKLQGTYKTIQGLPQLRSPNIIMKSNSEAGARHSNTTCSIPFVLPPLPITDMQINEPCQLMLETDPALLIKVTKVDRSETGLRSSRHGRRVDAAMLRLGGSALGRLLQLLAALLPAVALHVPQEAIGDMD